MDKHLHLKLAIRCLSFVGFWQLHFQNRFLALLYSTYFKLVMVIYILVVVAEFIELCQVIQKDLEDLSVLLGLFLFHLLGLAKLLVLGGETVNKLKRKIIVTERNILKCEDEDVKMIYKRYVTMNYTANKIMIYISIFCYVLFTTSPYFTDLLNRPDPLYEIIDNTTIIYKPRPLPLPTWFPFDRYKYYWYCYAWHVIALSVIPPCIIGLNTFFYGLIIFAIGQLKILKHDLKNFKDDGLVEETLRKCILYHKAVIIYVADLSNAMKNFLLLDFVGCGFQIAVIGFQAAVMEFSPNFIKTVWYLVTMLTQLFLFYWFANETLLESVDVANAVWNSKWYTCNENTKRTLFIIMMRAQKPLVLSVGAFYHMSTETLVSIMRVSYSYAMLMRRIYNE